MNAIRQTQQLNKRELENATPPSASWHADYRDTAWVYVGGFPLDLSEGDVVTIMSQFGNPTHLNLVRDRETGKSKGFGFLKYEDQRSCDLAVDNLTGAEVLGRLLRVDHTRYKKRDDEDEDTYRIDRLEAEAEAGQNGQNGKRASDTEESEDERRRSKKRRHALREERKSQKMLAIKHNDEDDEDPMKGYLVREKRKQRDPSKDRDEKHDTRHRHHHHRRDHRDRRDEGRDSPHRQRHGERENLSARKSQDMNREDRSTRRERGEPPLNRERTRRHNHDIDQVQLQLQDHRRVNSSDDQRDEKRHISSRQTRTSSSQRRSSRNHSPYSKPSRRRRSSSDDVDEIDSGKDKR